jgi:salicylate hydroxylase
MPFPWTCSFHLDALFRIGEDRHVMTYTIAGGKSFNMVLSHVDHSDPAKWEQKTAIEDMRNYFTGWDPR